jgi:hypothetical protein
VIRLLLSLLCALGLALAPVAAGAAALSSDSMPGCTMGKDMPAKSTDHGKMDCCTPVCQPASAAALLPSHPTETEAFRPNAIMFASAPVKELISVFRTGLDPPPRA